MHRHRPAASTPSAKKSKPDKFKWKPELEDVHMNIESELTTPRARRREAPHRPLAQRPGRRWTCASGCATKSLRCSSEIADLQRALVSLGEKNADVIIPGYTHLQRAQPVYFAHHLLAYVEMLERDCERLWDCHSRVNVCPLGSGAIAGSTLPLNRELVAKLLDFVNASGQVASHAKFHGRRERPGFRSSNSPPPPPSSPCISRRLAEDVILWASAEFNFIKIADAYTTGSSLMPQKKNPDVAELARGKTGRVIGNLMSLLTLLKGLPMTYNRDLQEDKERLFDTADTVRACDAPAWPRCCDNTKVNTAACAAAASDPALLATDLADYLVKKGMPFRQAHHVVGAVVALAEKTGKPLNQLTLAELQSVDKTFGARRAERVRSENRDEQTQSHRRTRNEGSR
jgi:argininosuccinate lyase